MFDFRKAEKPQPTYAFLNAEIIQTLPVSSSDLSGKVPFPVVRYVRNIQQEDPELSLHAIHIFLLSTF